MGVRAPGRMGPSRRFAECYQAFPSLLFLLLPVYCTSRGFLARGDIQPAQRPWHGRSRREFVRSRALLLRGLREPWAAGGAPAPAWQLHRGNARPKHADFKSVPSWPCLLSTCFCFLRALRGEVSFYERLQKQTALALRRSVGPSDR